MTIKRLIELLENPSQLKQGDAAELKELCGRYPYFYQAAALYLKCLKDSEDLQYNAVLKSVALQSPDRAVLQEFLQIPQAAETEAAKETQAAPVEQTPAVSTPAAVQPQAEAAKETPEPKPAPRPSIRAIETEYKLDESDISPEHKLKHQDLIDKFIELNPHISPVGKMPLPSSADDSSRAGDLDISYTEEDVTDSVFSESLARIYIKQKQYAKAIRIFEKLNLKYPEKSSYFADQIRFLNKVISNS